MALLTGVRSVRWGSCPRRMTLGIVVFGAAFLVGLALGTSTRRPLAVAGIVLGSVLALLVAQTHEPFVAFAAFALVSSVRSRCRPVRETLGLLLGR